MQKNNILDIFGHSTLIVWTVICLAIFMYFPGTVNHMQGADLFDLSTLSGKLSTISPTKYFLDTFKSLLGMLFFVTACTSLGMSIFNVFRLENKITNANSPSWTLLPTSFLIGNAIYSLLFLALASLFHLSAMLSFVLLSLGLFSGLPQLRKLSPPVLRFNAGKGQIIVVLSAAIIAVSIFQSSTRISYDASSVYFSNAKLTALEQHTAYFIENIFVASVFHSAIQYTVVLQVFGDQAARMVTWFFGLASILIALSLAKSVGASPLAQRILPALILTSTAFSDLLGDGKVDLFSTAYSLAAVYWFIVKKQNPSQMKFQYLLSGFLIGFACILRPYNVFLLGMFVLINTIQRVKLGRLHFLQIVRHLSWMVLGAVGFAIYHLFINKVVLGSPFAFLDSLTHINATNGPWDFKHETIWVYRLLYPFVITFKNSGASLGNISPLVIVFLPTLMVSDIRKHTIIQKETSRLFFSAGIVLLLWIVSSFTVVEVRYVLFLWIILFIPIAEIVASAFNTKFALLRHAAKWSIVLLSIFIFVRSAYISIATYSPLDTQGNPQCSGDIFCSHFIPINEIAKKGERVLTLSAFRYYMRTDLFACSTTKEEYRKLKALSFTSTESFWREVYQMGYTYVAFEEGYALTHLGFSNMPFSSPPDWVQLTPIIITSKVFNIAAYKLNSVNPPVNSEIVCKQDSSGIWHLQQK